MKTKISKNEQQWTSTNTNTSSSFPNMFQRLYSRSDKISKSSENGCGNMNGQCQFVSPSTYFPYPVFLFVCLCLFAYFSVSVRLSVYPCLCVCMLISRLSVSTCLPVYLSVCPSVRLCLILPVSLSACISLSVCLTMCLYVCRSSVCLSVSVFDNTNK